MQPILDDMLQDCKQKVYYKELQTALEGPQGKVVWQFVPKVNPDELATPAETEEALHYKGMVTEAIESVLDATFADEIAAQKHKNRSQARI